MAQRRLIPEVRIFDPPATYQPENDISKPETLNEWDAVLRDLVDIHIDCINVDHTILNFLPPLENRRIHGFWRGQVDSMRQGERMIIYTVAADGDEGDKPAAVVDTEGMTAQKGGELKAEDQSDRRRVTGVVMLATPTKEAEETGTARGSVQKLLVSPWYRRRGVAKALMAKVEEVALGMGRPLLLLDTEKGSEADFVYPKLGYILFGEVPNFDYSPLDRQLKTNAYYCKDLRTCERIKL